MEAVVFILTFIGGIAGIYTILDYRKNHVNKPREELQHLIIQFRSTQQICRDVIVELTAYAEEKNAYDEILNVVGFSVKTYLAALESTLKTHLSDETIDKINDLSPSSDNIQSMVRSLEQQFNALLEVQSFIKLKRLS